MRFSNCQRLHWRAGQQVNTTHKHTQAIKKLSLSLSIILLLITATEHPQDCVVLAFKGFCALVTRRCESFSCQNYLLALGPWSMTVGSESNTKGHIYIYILKKEHENRWA